MIRVHHPEELAKSEQERKNSFYCAQEAIYCAARSVETPQLAIMVISKIEEKDLSRSMSYGDENSKKIKRTLQERGVSDVYSHNFIGTCLVDFEPHNRLAEFIKDPFAKYKVDPIYELTSSALHKGLDEIRKKYDPKKYQETRSKQAVIAFINSKKYALGVGLATSLAVSMSPAVRHNLGKSMLWCGMAGLIAATAYGIKKIVDAL